jgi:hypothetical protein
MKDLSNSGVCVGNDRTGLAADAAANFAHAAGESVTSSVRSTMFSLLISVSHQCLSE